MKTKKGVLFCIHLSVNGRIILQRIVRNQVMSMWFGFVWNTIGPLVGLYKKWQIFSLHKMRQTLMNWAAVKLLWINLIHEAAIMIRPNAIIHFMYCISWYDRLCGLVVRVSGYTYRGLGFDSRLYQIFLSSSWSETGSTQPREPCEVNWGATWIKK